ncbi:hypothetical protein L5515_019533 [Caenorhabditis briggsae]|uniref:Non-specific serine/threonine protein kinase n=1 Tax=Caenorhabditis briggsae TaxID=6238 RepID=A0AAE9FLZ7_CAEBR|nr:hypothetical protein L5515_019533 [Caenorhabditis briggsae]
MNPVPRKSTIANDLDRLLPENLDILKLVGRGGYGNVYQVRQKTDGGVYAMKVVTKTTKAFDPVHLAQEKKIMATVKNPFLCVMHHSFENYQKAYLVLEFLSGGEMFTYLNKKKKLDEETTRFYIAEIVLALEYLHKNDVIYRDLKPENIMFDKNGHSKLIDFGLSKSNVPKGGYTTTLCGTMEFMAPEIIRRSPYGHPADIWALGILMFDMLAGGPPFYGRTKQELAQHILHGKIGMPIHISLEARDVIKGLITRAPLRRITIPDIKETAFFEPMDWEKLKARQIKPPFQPLLESNEDVSQFDVFFTEMAPEDPSCETAELDENSNQEADPFAGFEFQGPIIKNKKLKSSKSRSNIIKRWILDKFFTCLS